jgi:hypothetical protein
MAEFHVFTFLFPIFSLYSSFLLVIEIGFSPLGTTLRLPHKDQPAEILNVTQVVRIVTTVI